MRKAIIILLLSIVLSSAFAAPLTPYIRQYQNSFNVDLASRKYLSHLAVSSFENNQNADPTGIKDSGKYFKLQELGVFGINGVKNSNANGIDSDVTLTVEMTSGSWFYQLAGSEFKRPFGLDIFARGRLNNTDVDVPFTTGQSSLQLGNQVKGHWGESGTVTATMAFDDIKNMLNIWWDFCLVMDPEVDPIDDCVRYMGETYELSPSENSYTVDFTITISYHYKGGPAEGVTHSFPIHLEGFYKPSFVDNKIKVNASLVINKMTQADELRLDDVAGSLTTTYNKAYTQAGDATPFITVATYSLSSSSIDSSQNGESRVISLFLSSSSSAMSGGEKFSLRHIKDPYGAHVKPLVYEACLTSDSKGHIPGGSSKTVVFDGTSIFDFSQGEEEQTKTLKTNRLDIDATVVQQKNWTASWFDTGTIGIRLTGERLPTNNIPETVLPEGEYTSTIYIHIITF